MNSKCSTFDDENRNFEIDSALLRVVPHFTGEDDDDDDLTVFTKSNECYQCPLLSYCRLSVDSVQQLFVNTSFETELSLRRTRTGFSICEKNFWFGERGIYNLTIDGSNGNYSCAITVDREPINIFLPILTSFLVFGLLIGSFYIFGFIKKKWASSENTPAQYHQLQQENPEIDNSGAVASYVANEPKVRERLRSLDTFRGLSIVIMIFVNYGGGKYWFFQHSAWNGLTLADLVFPWFMFVMGTSMALTFDSLTKRRASLKSKLLNTLRRSVVLFLLGIMLNSAGNPDFKKLRILGVLQRFGVTYLIFGLMRSFRAVKIDEYRVKFASLDLIRDVVNIWFEWLVGLILVIVWLVITFCLPVPGCPTGYLGPGGIGGDGLHPQCTGGAAQYIDRLVLGSDRLYQNPTCKSVYLTNVPFDPEGTLGFLTSTFLVLLGLQAGQIILFYSDWKGRMKRYTIWAVVCGLLGGILCDFKQNGGWIPVNKNLWSLSYTLTMACFAFTLLLFFFWIIDIKGYWTGAPFHQAGMNSIFLYLGHEIMEHYLPFSWIPFSNSHWEYLAMNLWGTCLWTLIAVIMDHKKLYLSI